MQYDITGKKFGKWTVGKYVQEKGGKPSHYWCTCECGTVKLVLSRELRNGSTTNCGCSARVSEGLVALRAVLTTYRSTAARRGLSWGLKTEEFMNLVLQKCYYCGRPPHQYRAYREKGGAYYTGIDRVSNDAGYLPDNVVPCCKICNRAKQCMRQEDFYQWVRMVYAYSASRERGM
jgi:hypothetical protein